jgi:hypothetical protein
MAITHHDVLGFVGALAIVVAFFGNMRGMLVSDGLAYPLLNLVGASLILYSLFWEWNFSAAVMEGFWVAISVYGLVKYARARQS